MSRHMRSWIESPSPGSLREPPSPTRGEGKTFGAEPAHSNHTARRLALLRLPGQALQQPLDFAALLALADGPFANHLLLGPHVADQSLDRLGEVGHRRGGAAVAAFLHRGAQPLDGSRQFAAAASGADAVAAIFAYRGGEPVLEIGVEAVLRLARLQIEEAEAQRAGETEP